MKKYKNIIFDCDGTLLDSSEATLGAFRDLALECLNRDLTEDEEYSIFHQPSLESMAKMGISTTRTNILKLGTYFVRNSDDLGLFPGLEEVLATLQEKGVHIGMATNRNRVETEYALKENGLFYYCDKYVCRDDVEHPKPSGEMLALYLDKNNLKKEETIYLGNAISDHLAALDIGLDYGYCMWGTSATKEEEEHIKITKPEEILELI